ncbi:integrase, catalytic region, zinc finger, CCHC-type containing protein [Tanacetum coccineum]
MLAEAQEAGQILDKEQLAFLADLGISEAPVAQQTIPQNLAFQTDELDAYDSDCDDLSSTKAVLVANLLSCDPEVLSEVPYSDSYPNDMINQDVQEMQNSKQTHVDDFEDNEIHSVEQMTDHAGNLDKENQTNKMVNESLTAELERYKERIAIFEQRLNVDLNQREKLINSQMDDLICDRYTKLTAFQQEIDTLKETLSNNVKENESLSKTLTVFKIESKEKVSKYIDKEIVLENKIKNWRILFRIQPTLYDGSVIAKEHAVIFVIDDEETLILEEESRSKMLDKQNNLNSIENKIKISPIDYSKLNKIKEDFVLKDIFNAFDKTLLDEITKVQTIFNQMQAAVDQCFLDKNVFEIQIKQLRIDSDQLLNQIMSQEIVHIVANSVDILDVKKSCVNDCNKCLELKTGLFKKKDFFKKDAYDKLVKSHSNLEKHCISLELATQVNQEIFQRENSGKNLYAPTFNKLFEINKLKAQSQEKDTVIRMLKERIKSLSGKDSVENVKKDIDEIETINIKLEHSVAKLLSENEHLRNEREHLKSIYKDQFDSNRKTMVQSKEHCGSLIAQINAKSIENSDLNAQLQERIFAITTLKNELRKLKGKNVVNTAVSKTNATIAQGMFMLDIEPISPSLKNNRDAHETCPSSPKSSGKLVTVTPINKDKRVRFVEPVTSSNNIPKQTYSLKTNDSNKPLLTSIGVKPTTSANGSKPSGNTKNNRITRPAAIRRIKITPKKIVHLEETTSKSVETPKPDIKVYSRRPKQIKSVGSSKRAKIVESKTANNSESTHLWGSNATDVSSSSSLFSDRLSRSSSGSRDTNLYTISLNDMLKTSSVCLLSKASKTKSWLWHRRLSYLNFGTLNKLAKDGLARGIPKLKFQKDHLCSACALEKSKKSSYQPKAEDTN